jgi:SAM-dependent methyltransferase
MSASLDTQAIGLDVGLGFVKWLTGAENLHYGLWDGLDVTAANLGTAQAAYTSKLFALLPPGPLRILDVGGGAGETARKLAALGHRVEIVVPSPLLARHCRANAPDATVHFARFEDAALTGRFDVCLFSESFQYIPLHASLPKASALVGPGGTILIADCFRAPGFKGGGKVRTVGGGHPMAKFRRALAEHGLEVLHDEDITPAVAPSIDLEAGLFRVFGQAVTRVDEELAQKRPTARWALDKVFRTTISERRRHRLMERLAGEGRTSEAFLASNRYLMVKLRVPA